MGAPVSFGGADHRERLGFLADVFPVRSDVLDGVAHHQSHRAAQQRIQPPNQCDGSDGRRNLNLSLFGLCSTNHGIPLEFSSAFSMVHRLHTKCRLTSTTFRKVGERTGRPASKTTEVNGIITAACEGRTRRRRRPMRLKKARVRKYRSIRDTGEFEVEKGKSILVGPNEAGKTVLLQALQQVNPPKGVRGFDALRDYPRSEYNDITTGRVRPEDVTVVEAHFALEDADKDAIPA